MSGHSKWHTIKHKKGLADAKRGAAFTKIIKELSISARLGGGDPETNPRLRTGILKAKAVNMPKDNIERAIKKGTGELEGVNYEEILYEAYGPGGVAILINILTDNKNRAAAEIRNLLNKHGGNLGAAGSVAYLFKRKGLLNYDSSKYKEDDILAVAIDAGAEDVSNDGDSIEVSTSPDDFEAVLKALEAKGFESSGAEISQVADTTVTLDNEKTGKALKLVELLEDHEDVQSVATNLEIPAGFEMDEE
jgi:YebC/PmpR family DNA-binding regulatory protein